MLFNSIDFAIFLPIVFILYWMLSKAPFRWQNVLILLASYFFYGCWDYRFLALIGFSTLVDYFIGIKLSETSKKHQRLLLLWVSIIVNLGFLGFFKYYNFFVSNFVSAFSFFGMAFKTSTLNIVLPVGISFYTFQTMSYTIDVYREKLKPTRDFIAFGAFVSFFPQLVAGPIERATNLLPQFFKKRTFNYGNAVDGMKQILWGLFKKMVIADNCAVLVDLIFETPGDASGSTLFLGSVLFAFQIYGDFSGYSDIAIGTARLFGFNLMQNFAFPYFSRNIAEFWRRWHISLSTWFRDYLYIPLGGSRGSLSRKIRNIFIIFIVSGFWHGANWTFIVWGALNAIYFLPLLLRHKNRNYLDTVAESRKIPTGKEFLAILGTFVVTCFAWIFFRAANVSEAVAYISNIFDQSFFTKPELVKDVYDFPLVYLLVGFVLLEWLARRTPHGLSKLGEKWPRLFRWSFYSFLIFLIGMFMQTEETPFIYFQF